MNLSCGAWQTASHLILSAKSCLLFLLMAGCHWFDKLQIMPMIKGFITSVGDIHELSEVKEVKFGCEKCGAMTR